jgi:hypothetical protein
MIGRTSVAWDDEPGSAGLAVPTLASTGTEELWTPVATGEGALPLPPTIEAPAIGQ